MSLPSEPRNSKAWFLLPIFLGIIGGFIMFMILRQGNPGMAKNGVILGAVLTTLFVVITVAPLSMSPESPDVILEEESMEQGTAPAPVTAPSEILTPPPPVIPQERQPAPAAVPSEILTLGDLTSDETEFVAAILAVEYDEYQKYEDTFTVLGEREGQYDDQGMYDQHSRQVDILFEAHVNNCVNPAMRVAAASSLDTSRAAQIILDTCLPFWEGVFEYHGLK
ncbi:MAG: hypothetical protein OXK17_09010 [Thaumarchaeota archaeon]|nr:hypothetical protein [Nitrososphaerota archaeon]